MSNQSWRLGKYHATKETIHFHPQELGEVKSESDGVSMALPEGSTLDAFVNKAS